MWGMLLLPMLLLLLYSILCLFSTYHLLLSKCPVTFHSAPKQKSCTLFSNFHSLIAVQHAAIFPQPWSFCILIDLGNGWVFWDHLSSILCAILGHHTSHFSKRKEIVLLQPTSALLPSPILPHLFPSLSSNLQLCLFNLSNYPNIHFPFSSAPQVKVEL